MWGPRPFDRCSGHLHLEVFGVVRPLGLLARHPDLRRAGTLHHRIASLLGSPPCDHDGVAGAQRHRIVRVPVSSSRVAGHVVCFRENNFE